MAEDSQGVNAPEKVTPAPATPTGNQQVPEPQQVEPEAGQETPDTSSQPETGEDLPANVQQHNREYIQKLETEKEQLKRELAAKKQNENFFKTIQPPPSPQPEPVIDPYTGQVDERLTAINRKAWEAEQRANQAIQGVNNFYAEQERREAIRIVGPELDSQSPKFNQELHDLTAAILMQNMTNPTATPMTYAEAGQKAKTYLSNKNVDKVKQEAAAEAIEKLSPKEQAALEATGNPNRRLEAESTRPDLQERTRRGDLDAVMARLKNIPSVGKG